MQQEPHIYFIWPKLNCLKPRKNVNKDGICLLSSRPIDPKQRTQRCNWSVKKIEKIQRR